MKYCYSFFRVTSILFYFGHSAEAATIDYCEVSGQLCVEGSRNIPSLNYHPVVVLPPPSEITVLDLTKEFSPESYPLWNIGKYNEDRIIYTQPLFGGKRTIHIGIDIGAPAHTAVHAFWDGEVIEAGTNDADGDYGPTLITGHYLQNGTCIYALYGHLSPNSLELSQKGRKFKKGEVLGWIGTKEVNGGWPPHVHFQLSWEKPVTHDLPGAVSREQRASALQLYPDPRLVLGNLYQ